MNNNVIVMASNNGLVKVLLPKKNQVVHSWGQQKLEEEVTKMIWLDEEETVVVLGKKNGTISLNSIEDGNVIESYKVEGGVAALVAMENGKILACSDAGEIGVWKNGEELEKFALNRHVDTSCLLFSHSLVGGCSAPKATSSKSVERFIVSGGEGQSAQMFDIETKTTMWTARNVPCDFLDMEVPIHDRCLSWIDPQHSFLSVTAHCQIRTYDIRAQRRPVTTTDYGSRALVISAVVPWDNNLAVVGDTEGSLCLLDRRKNFISLGRYKEIAGSIRSLDFLEEERCMAAVGLDRFLHIYDVASKKNLFKSYVKQRMNAVLFCRVAEPVECTEPSEEKKEKRPARVDNYEGLDSLLEALPQVGGEERGNSTKKKGGSEDGGALRPPSQKRKRQRADSTGNQRTNKKGRK